MENSGIRTNDETKAGKQLYEYQKGAIDDICRRILEKEAGYNLLYQLPTGGGKTVIFSEIARRYILETGKKVVILTHRIELCSQTTQLLREFGVHSKIINSDVKELPASTDFMCFVAMVETLNNRLHSNSVSLDGVGLVIVDEAHYNSFRKLFRFFENSILLGVTATPLSSNVKLPMKDHYDELIVGESIGSLIQLGFLARATTYSYHVGLSSLKIGINGDYTVSSSDKLYSNVTMQQKLLTAYEDKCKGKKTLIFNNGIQTSKQVYSLFQQKDYPIRHLDNTHSNEERKEILQWFKTTPDAILTSVSILTTGFDEPSVECIIINRATRSLTLYYQMIGRGSRILNQKREFIVIDLGNNLSRFGLWENPVDWMSIFRAPDLHLASILSDEMIEKEYVYLMPEDLKHKFKNSNFAEFNVKMMHQKALNQGLRPKQVLDWSIEQHVQMCRENSSTLEEGLMLLDYLEQEIDYRLKQFSYCISKSSDNYVKWLKEEYKRKARLLLTMS